jgi:hypothetical protein
MAQFMAAAVIGALALAAALEPAGEGVRLGVAIAAMAATVLAYAWMGATVVRAYRRVYGDDEAGKRAVWRRGRIVMLLMVVTPLVVAAAHPWGLPASILVGYGAVFLCSLIFTKVTLIASLVLRGRPRPAAPPA